MADATRRLRIHGRVQGVFYRAWAVQAARALRLDGWVRNRRDGTVEMLVHGPAEAVQSLIEACREGPPAAEVERIEVEDTEEAAPPSFEGRPTF